MDYLEKIQGTFIHLVYACAAEEAFAHGKTLSRDDIHMGDDLSRFRISELGLYSISSPNSAATTTEFSVAVYRHNGDAGSNAKTLATLQEYLIMGDLPKQDITINDHSPRTDRLFSYGVTFSKYMQLPPRKVLDLTILATATESSAVKFSKALEIAELDVAMRLAMQIGRGTEDTRRTAAAAAAAILAEGQKKADAYRQAGINVMDNILGLSPVRNAAADMVLGNWGERLAATRKTPTQ